MILLLFIIIHQEFPKQIFTITIKIFYYLNCKILHETEKAYTKNVFSFFIKLDVTLYICTNLHGTKAVCPVQSLTILEFSK